MPRKMPQIAPRFDAEIHTHYDEADLAAINAGRHLMGEWGRSDENTIFFARQLEYIKARAYVKKYPEMKGNLLVPVSTEVPEWAEFIVTRTYDEVGMAKVIANYADDMPRADVRAQEASVRVRTIGDSYGYNIVELMASTAQGQPLSTAKASAARRAIDEKLNRISLIGDPIYNLGGLLTNPNIPEVTITGDWLNPATTAESMLTDANALYIGIINQSNGVHRPNFWALPPAEHAMFTTRVMPDSGGKTAATFFREMHPEIRIEPVYELKGADAGENVTIMYERTEENLRHELLMPFRQLPPEARNLEFVVNCMARSGGVHIEYPLAFAKGVGI